MPDDEFQEAAPPEAVESDPSRRYWRFEDMLGSGACKTVYKAFDSQEGIEVAWNKVALGSAALHQDTMRKRLFSEIHVLKRLQHKNIMTFHDYWLDSKTTTLNFITELFTHGSLKRFRAQHKHIAPHVLKKWAWHILQGLVYLHGHEPPIIHRDLKCDNIFINGVTGDLKIGDLGLATLWTGLAPLTVIGTPEFMAPEFYNEKYDEKVDVYAFGMLLLELDSMEYPYCECTNPAAIYKKVSDGVSPASLQKIKNQELKDFIELCIAYDPEKRPEARQLLKHQFFNSIRKTMESRPRYPHDKSEPELGSSSDRTSECSSTSSSDAASDRTVGPSIVAAGGNRPLSVHLSSDHSHSGSSLSSETDDEESEPDDDDGDIDGNVTRHKRINFKIECKKVEGEPVLNFSLTYKTSEGTTKKIEFPFNIEDDTAEQIVTEMRDDSCNEIDILMTEEEATTIGQLIGEEVDRWKLKDNGHVEAFVSVTRNHCEDRIENTTPEEVNTEDLQEARNRVVMKEMDRICQTMASDFSEENVFKTLDQESGTLMDYVAGKEPTPGATSTSSNRRSMVYKLSGMEEDESTIEGGMNEGNILFANSPSVQEIDPLQQQYTTDVLLLSQERQGNEEDIGSNSSLAIDIPKRRRMSANFERSQSLSSPLPEAQQVHSYDGASSPFGRSAQRKLSGRNGLLAAAAAASSSFTTHGDSSLPQSSLRNVFYRRSVSLTAETRQRSLPPNTKLQSSLAPIVPAELSVVYLGGGQNESENITKVGEGQENKDNTVEVDVGQQDLKQPSNNSCLISVVTVKPATTVSSTMPTVHEFSSKYSSSSLTPTPPPPPSSSSNLSSNIKKSTKQLIDRESVKSKADEYLWKCANEPLIKDSENTSQHTHSPEVSPRSSIKYMDFPENSTDSGNVSGAKCTNHGKDLDLKQHSNPKEKDSFYSHESVQQLPSMDSLIEPSGIAEKQHSLEAQRLSSSPFDSNHQLMKTKVPSLDNSKSPKELVTTYSAFDRPLGSQQGADNSFSVDDFDFLSPFATPRPNFQPEYQDDRTEGWKSGQIRAFRNNSNNSHAKSGSIDDLSKSYPMNDKGHLTLEAQHNLERMFISCQNLSELVTDSSNNNPSETFSNTFHSFSQFPSLHSTSSNHHQGSPPGLSLTDGGVGFSSSYQNLYSDSAGIDESKTENPETLKKKTLRRQQAEEDIGRMQEQQLEKLCSGSTVGVGLPRPKSHRPSMNGSINF